MEQRDLNPQPQPALLNHDYPSKRNTGSGRIGIVQLPRGPATATANSFRKLVGLKQAVWEQVK
jgi:hypothetical protein